MFLLLLIYTWDYYYCNLESFITMSQIFSSSIHIFHPRLSNRPMQATNSRAKNCWVWYTGHDEIVNQYKFFRSNEKRYLPIKISTFCRWERRAIKCCSSASLRSATSVLMILSFLWKILNKQIDKKFKTLTLYRSIILSNVCDNISIVLFNSFDFVSLIIVRQ